MLCGDPLGVKWNQKAICKANIESGLLGPPLPLLSRPNDNQLLTSEALQTESESQRSLMKRTPAFKVRLLLVLEDGDAG